MQSSLIHRLNTPRHRLAITYLAIIMVLSLSFSVVFYHETSRAAGSGFRRQVVQLRDNLYFTRPGVLDRIRDDGIDRFNENIIVRLVLLNCFMLIAGGALSYYLAQKSLEPLEEAMARQGRFTSDAAHELRTPLTVMKAEVEVMLRSKKLDAKEARNVLQSNLEEIEKLETLTEALLRLSKGDTAKKEHKEVVVTDIITAAAARVMPQAKEKGITFDLPPSTTERVMGDYDQLVELFVVLFDNAVKYGTEKMKVTVRALHNQEFVVVSVQDQGVGIHKKDLPHIFERFYRADTSRTKGGASGYGLGLSVADAIVKSHNGTIEAESKPGKGTTFTVTLPR